MSHEYSENTVRARVHSRTAAGMAANPVGFDLSEVIDAEPWVVDAICPTVDPEIFFPEKGGSTREAKKICALCPVTSECLDYALRNDERFGIYGGKSERERRQLPKPIPPQQHCRNCAKPFTVNRMGPATVYCSRDCRETAAERRTA